MTGIGAASALQQVARIHSSMEHRICAPVGNEWNYADGSRQASPTDQDQSQPDQGEKQ